MKRPIHLFKETLAHPSVSHSFEATLCTCVTELNLQLAQWSVAVEILVLLEGVGYRYSDKQERMPESALRIFNYIHPFASHDFFGCVKKRETLFKDSLTDYVQEMVGCFPARFLHGSLVWVCRGAGCAALIGGERRFKKIERYCARTNRMFAEVYTRDREQKLALEIEANEAFKLFTHELKSPLQQLYSISKKQPSASEIESVIRHAQTMVRDVIDFSHAPALYVNTYSIRELVKELTLYYTHHPLNSIIEWSCDDVEVVCDLVRLFQVAVILLDNALAACTIHDRIWLECIDESAGVTLSFFNTGAMIPREIYSKIFTPYMTTKKEGSGLGLPMAIKLMRMMRGTIELTESSALRTQFKCRIQK